MGKSRKDLYKERERVRQLMYNRVHAILRDATKLHLKPALSFANKNTLDRIDFELARVELGRKRTASASASARSRTVP